MLCCYSVWTWVNYPARMGFNPPFDRDGKVICSQRYDFDILGVVEKWGISYSPKIIHTGTVNGQNDDEPEKMLVHLLSYKPIVCLVAPWRTGSSITISGDHPRERYNPSLEPDIWRNIQDGKWGELTLAYSSYLSTTVLNDPRAGAPKSLASGPWLRCMLPTKASSWKGTM